MDLHSMISEVSSSKRAAWLVFHLFVRPSFHFLLFSCTSRFFTLKHSFMYYQFKYLLQNFRLQGTSFHSPSFQNLLHPLISGPLHSCCQSSFSSSSSYSICEQSQFCLTLCPTVLCAVDLASSCALAFSLRAISFLILLSPLSSLNPKTNPCPDMAVHFESVLNIGRLVNCERVMFDQAAKLKPSVRSGIGIT